MAIDMRTVKNIEFNNKQVKKIEDANGNILWQKFSGNLNGVIAKPLKIFSQTGSAISPTNPLYWTISQLSSSIASPSSSNDASTFYFFTENQILALLDENFDFENGTYNNERIGYIYNDGYFHLKTPEWKKTPVVYICFIQNNKLYFVSNKTTNSAVNNGLLGYTDDYTNAYIFKLRLTSYGNDIVINDNRSYHIENRYNNTTLKYMNGYGFDWINATTTTGDGNGIIPYQSITNPNANN